MKKKLIRWLNGVLSLLIALLGFSSCDRENKKDEPDDYPLLMYGSPYTEYKVSGLVTDKGRHPVANVRILLRKSGDRNGRFNYASYATDTAYTDSKGRYLLEGRSITEYTRVVCEDLSGTYEADSADMKLRFVKDKRKDQWYQGTAKKKVNFTIIKSSGK